MVRKIIVLNGSPRKKGNTAALVREFVKGAEEVGCQVDSFLLHDMNIEGCKGCWQGGGNPQSPCTTKDDMDKIYPRYQEADVVVLASPLYYWSISGQLKNTFDRLFAVAEMNENYRNPKKESVLLMAAEGKGFEESIYWYERLMDHVEWTDRGRVLAGGVHNPGDIEGNPELKQAYVIGRALGSKEQA